MGIAYAQPILRPFVAGGAVSSPHERSDMRDHPDAKTPDIAALIRASLAEAACRAGKPGAGRLWWIRQLWHDEAPTTTVGVMRTVTPHSGQGCRPTLHRYGLTPSGYPKIVFSNLGNRALMSASRKTLRCSTPFFVVWIRPASRRIRKWFDSVDLAMPGHGVASVQDMQSFFCSSRLLTIRSRIGSASAASTPANVMFSRDG
jgi:hypothetical protein